MLEFGLYALTSRTLDLGFRVVISQPDFRRGLVSLDFGWILQFKLSLVFHAKGLVSSFTLGG